MMGPKIANDDLAKINSESDPTIRKEYSIEDEIIQEKIQQGRPPKYPFRKMKVGQSFFVPYEDLIDRSNPLNILRSSASIYGTRNNKKFKVSFVQKEGGFRVWRVI